MDEQALQQIQQLVAAALQGDPRATDYINQIMQAAQQGDQQAAQMAQVIQQVAQQMQGGGQPVPSNRNGAKLEYIKRLNDICPEGYEMKMFKAGGRICKKCMKKAEQGTKVNKAENGSPVDGFKAEMAKCGAKTKKPKACGGKKLI